MATVAQTLRFDGELGSRLIANLPVVVAYLLVVLIAFRAAVFVIYLAEPPAAENMAPINAAPTRNVADLPSILRAGLFGQSAPTGGGGATPITSMQLVLAGVVAASDEKLGYAMIGPNATSIEMKKVGDVLPGGATLHAVHVDRVLLNRGGVIEALVLPEAAPVSFAPQPTGTAASIARVEQALRGNPNAINQVMQRTLVITDGRIRGVRVSPGPNAAAFSRLGLRNGDIVTAINGVPLNDEARSRDVFDSLSGAAEAHLTIERNGMPQELVLNLAEITSEAEQIASTPVEPPPPPAGMPTEALGMPSPALPPDGDPESMR